ncbi:hypothetical protein ACIHEI_34180 [Kitasatospora sp. NPDC051984]|uniref:hypothetical protein n=1 Tax=Kitasatospora sp. NPDC051984 TaxID=3364059 RepID=UPI0037C8A4E5
MTTAVPFSTPRHANPLPGDAVEAPASLMSGPGRSWQTEPRWRWVEIRLGGQWLPGRVERWRLHQGSPQWVALVRWGPDLLAWAWYLYDPETIRQVPEPAPGSGPTTW